VAAVSAAPVAIELHNASFGWHGHAALRGVSGRFEPGAMTAVIGPNGAGKSTLVKGIMGVLRPMSGRVSIGGAGRAELAWLPQAAELDRAFPVTVLDLVALGAWRRVGGWRRYGGDELDRCMQALETVGLADMAGHGVDTLSGGQMQRTLFARMLVQDAPVLLLDEPFTAVDSHTADDLMALLCGLHGQGRSVIAVLHDMDMVREHFPQCLLLSGSVVAWGDTQSVLTDAHLKTARQWHARAYA
jgi:zinc/manganese transport system ATP-binding protein